MVVWGGLKVVGIGVYVVVKGVVVFFICQLVVEGVLFGICVVSFSFGFVVMLGIEEFLKNLQMWVVLFDGVLMDCLGELEEVVVLVLFLVFSEVFFVMGFDFVIDGGLLVIQFQVIVSLVVYLMICE